MNREQLEFTRRDFFNHFGRVFFPEPESQAVEIASPIQHSSENLTGGALAEASVLEAVTVTITAPTSELTSETSDEETFRRPEGLNDYFIAKRNLRHDRDSVFATEEFNEVLEEFSGSLEVVKALGVTIVSPGLSVRILRERDDLSLFQVLQQARKTAAELKPFMSTHTTAAQLFGARAKGEGKTHIGFTIDAHGADSIVKDIQEIFASFGLTYHHRREIQAHVSVLKGYDHEAAKRAMVRLNQIKRRRRPIALGEVVVDLSSR